MLLGLSRVGEEGELDTMNVSLQVFCSELGEVWNGGRALI